jgi:hypothetical protein
MTAGKDPQGVCKMEKSETNFEARVKKAVQEMIALGYSPRVFENMIFELGTVAAVKKLINTSRVTEGFTRLWELNRLDLSMENIIQEAEWKDLFSDAERETAKKRLAEYRAKI